MRITSSHGEVRLVNGKRISTPEYGSWQMMKNRCFNPKALDWKYYGGRGIKIAQAWLRFDNFLADMGRKPTFQHTLDRKNVHGKYCKQNCVWATRRLQAQNKTNSRFTIALAEKIRKQYASGKYCQYELAAMYGTSQAAISQITRNVAWLRETEGAR